MNNKILQCNQWIDLEYVRYQETRNYSCSSNSSYKHLNFSFKDTTRCNQTSITIFETEHSNIRNCIWHWIAFSFSAYNLNLNDRT